MKLFTYFVIVVVAASIVAGFFIVGSPGEERLRRFDEKKIQDLQFIQSEIIYYWQNKARLPANLNELNDGIRGVIVPSDPQTGEPYEYVTAGNLNFTLCATFNRQNQGALYDSPRAVRKAPYPSSEALGNISNWDHDSGGVCFERTIDPDIYKPIPPVKS